MLNPRLLFLWLLSVGAQRDSGAVPCPCCSSVKDNMKWTCLKSSWERAVGLGTAASPAQWRPCTLIQFLFPNNPCGSLATAASPAKPETHSTAGSNDHGVMLEDVLTVTLLIAIGKVRPQNSPAGSLRTQAVTELGWSEPRASTDSWVVC